jgi:hypothetical protein
MNRQEFIVPTSGDRGTPPSPSGPSGLSWLEPHGRLGRQPVHGLPRVRHLRHHRSVDPMPFPRIPQGDIVSVMSRRLGVLNDC